VDDRLCAACFLKIAAMATETAVPAPDEPSVVAAVPAADSDVAEPDTLEALQERHRREIKELQKTVQKIKHAVPKGDKRRLKEAQQEISALESGLHDRQSKELKAFKARAAVAEATIKPFTPPPVEGEVAALAADVEGALKVDGADEPAASAAAEQPAERRVTKAAKRRVRARFPAAGLDRRKLTHGRRSYGPALAQDKKAQREREIREQAELEAANTPNLMAWEEAELAQLLKKEGFTISHVRAEALGDLRNTIYLLEGCRCKILVGGFSSLDALQRRLVRWWLETSLQRELG